MLVANPSLVGTARTMPPHSSTLGKKIPRWRIDETMNEEITIRKYLNNRGRWTKLPALFLFGIFISSSLFKDALVVWSMILISSTCIVIVIAISLFLVRCPRCNGSMFRLLGTVGSIAKDGKHEICFCPYCGVKLDEKLTV